MRRAIVVAFIILLAVTTAQARRSKRQPVYRMFPPSTEALLQQNVEIDRLGLVRIANDAELHAFVQAGLLVPIPASKALHVDPRMPDNRRYVRPWVADFLTDVSERFYARYNRPLQVNSAVRTVAFQRRLARRNGNAAPARGEKASAHLAGVAVDIARRGLTKSQIAYLQILLFGYQQRELAIIEEEISQPCFHVMVMPGS